MTLYAQFDLYSQATQELVEEWGFRPAYGPGLGDVFAMIAQEGEDVILSLSFPVRNRDDRITCVHRISRGGSTDQEMFEVFVECVRHSLDAVAEQYRSVFGGFPFRG